MAESLLNHLVTTSEAAQIFKEKTPLVQLSSIENHIM